MTIRQQAGSEYVLTVLHRILRQNQGRSEVKKEIIAAVVLAGGSGTRMGTSCKKQYVSLNGKPMLYYALKAFQESSVDRMILVSNEPEYCRTEIIEKYRFHKTTDIVPGGAERYDSVYAGLLAAKDCDYVLVHDGARPLVSGETIEASIEAVRRHPACVTGVPAKDTIKIAGEGNFAESTPERTKLWQIQTPQAFSYPLLMKAYRTVLDEQPKGITDDAMIIEYGQYAKIKIIPGSYKNIKITTPEDLIIAEAFLREAGRK